MTAQEYKDGLNFLLKLQKEGYEDGTVRHSYASQLNSITLRCAEATNPNQLEILRFKASLTGLETGDFRKTASKIEQALKEAEAVQAEPPAPGPTQWTKAVKNQLKAAGTMNVHTSGDLEPVYEIYIVPDGYGLEYLGAIYLNGQVFQLGAPTYGQLLKKIGKFFKAKARIHIIEEDKQE